MKNLILQSLQIVKENKRAYVYINLFFYGLFILAVAFAGLSPDIHHSFLTGAKLGVQKGLLAPIYQLYHVERNIPLAAVLTFVINLIAGSGLMLTLPSLIIPFIGIPILMFRFILWGLIFGPEGVCSVAAAGTLLLEGQGYILAALGIYLHGMHFLRSKQRGFQDFKEGYVAGFKLNVRLYVLIAIVLLVAALYESIVGISTSKPPFPRLSKSYSQLLADEQRVDFSGSSVFYRSPGGTEADARVVGVLLEEIDYFRVGDTAFARISRDSSQYTIEVCLPSALWENDRIRDRFTLADKKLARVFPNRQYQITALAIDDSGKVTKKVFR
jgi:hypothetical protein